MAMFQRFRKGTTAKEATVDVATSWDEFEPEDYDGSEDGNDFVHHERMKTLVPRNLLISEVPKEDLANDESTGGTFHG